MEDKEFDLAENGNGPPRGGPMKKVSGWLSASVDS